MHIIIIIVIVKYYIIIYVTHVSEPGPRGGGRREACQSTYNTYV